MVVEIDFTLKNDQGKLLESTIDKAPYFYIHGSNRVVEGLEDGLEDLEVGSNFDFKIPPEKATKVLEEVVQTMFLDNFVDQLFEP